MVIITFHVDQKVVIENLLPPIGSKCLFCILHMKTDRIKLDLPGSTTLNATQALAENVRGVTVPLSAHWIPGSHMISLSRIKALKSHLLT